MKSPLRTLAQIRNKTPVPYTRSRGLRTPMSSLGRRGAEAQMRAMGDVGTLFAITNRTAKGMGGIEWCLYRKARSGDPEDRVRVTSHAALDLWNKPNPFYSQGVFVEAGSQHKLLTGEQWWVISRHPLSNLPLEMWPVRPDRMEPIPDPQEFLLGYMYRSPDGEEIALRREDVIFIRTPNPLDPYRGMGPVQALLADLDAVKYSAQWNRNFFLNSAEPGGVIEVPNALSDDEFDELRDRWNEQHKGVANAHRVAILEHGTWKDRKFSQRDMQFAELRQVSSEVIREAFGFPKPMLGSTDDVNRANADTGEVMFARWLLVPDARAIRDALNHDLLPMFGSTARNLEFDFVNPVPEDRELAARELEAKAASVKALVEAGVYGPEALDAVGLPAMAFGQPGADADPDRELLVALVTKAPTLAPVILPLLGYELAAPGAEPAATARLSRWERATAALRGATPQVPQIEAAQRWVAVAVDDEDTCEPCADNDGRTYKNREQAYRDYPGGEGYIHCIGAEYGNECRCKVVKRGRKGSDE